MTLISDCLEKMKGHQKDQMEICSDQKDIIRGNTLFRTEHHLNF